jgi:hypothetical protein
MQLDPDFDYDADGELCALEVTQRVCGPAVAQRLLEAFDGERVYFPLQPGADHPISQAIGHDNAKLLGREIGRLSLNVGWSPSRRRWNVVKWARLASLPTREIVRLTGYRETHVYYVIAKLRDAGDLPKASRA